MTAATEAAFIASIREPDDLGWAGAQGVTEEYFASHREVWQFLRSYYAQTGSLPPAELLRERFDTFEPPLVPPDKAYQVGLLRNDYLRRVANGAMLTAAKAIDEAPEEAIRQLLGELMRLRTATATGVSYYDADALQRLERLEQKVQERALRGEDFSGMRTGIELMDIQGEGWQPGEFGVIIARPGVGKTEVLCRTAAEMWMHGHRVLLVSLEMLKDQIAFRLDPIVARLMGMDQFPTNNALHTARMDDDDMRRYRSYAAELAKRDDLKVIDMEGLDHALTLDDVRGFAREHGASAVIIDGIKLLRGVGTSEWAQYNSLIRGCKMLAMSESITVLGAEHASRNVKSPSEPPGISEVYMGDSIPQWADRIITMAVPKIDSGTRRYIAIQKHRFGTAVPTRKLMAFDVNAGDIGAWVDPEEQKKASELGKFVSHTLSSAPPKQELAL